MNAFGMFADAMVEKTIRVYQSVLRWALGHRWTTIWIGMAVFVVSVGVAVLFLPTEFMPENDRGEVNGVIKLAIGTRTEITNEVMIRMEEYIERNVPEREVMFVRCGTSETGMESIMGQQSGPHVISLSLSLVSKGERKRSDKDISRMLAGFAQSIPGVVDVDFSSQQSGSMMGGKPISIELYGNSLAETDSLARNIRDIMASVRGITDIAISRESGKPELWVEIDRDETSTLGLTTGQIASTLRSSFYGTTATKYRDQGDEYDLFVRYREEDRQSAADIGNTLIMTPSGVQMPLRSLGRVTEEKGPVTLQRQDQGRVVYIEGGLYQRSLGEVVGELRPKLDRLNLPPGVSLEIGGSAADQVESFRWLFIALIAGIVLVYMVMAAQFESLRDPFIIMFSVPFSITGVIWGLFVTGYTLSLISFVGMIMLVGIVVNNAIVLVDYTNILRARGVPVHEAILTACRRRFRPVLMTALTTMLGLLPLAMSAGEGSETWAPLGVSVISGLFVSTVITLVFVPTLYALFEERRNRKTETPAMGGAAL
jgi:HAE1 family hydrophobic/amphiphilic exporter-1